MPCRVFTRKRARPSGPCEGEEEEEDPAGYRERRYAVIPEASSNTPPASAKMSRMAAHRKVSRNAVSL